MKHVIAYHFFSISALLLMTPHANAADVLPAIASLNEAQIDNYLAGRGMGLAKTAELNGYPGPAHVLERSDELKLNADQQRKTEALKIRVEENAKRLGARLVTRERKLDMLFASHRIDRKSLVTLTGEIGRLQGELRRVHLQAHIDETKLLSAEQLTRDAELRNHE